MLDMPTNKHTLVAVYFTAEELADIDAERARIIAERHAAALQANPKAKAKSLSRSNLIRLGRGLSELQHGGLREQAEDRKSKKAVKKRPRKSKHNT
jgi:hypothetical protein